jgi:hypothetical protein
MRGFTSPLFRLRHQTLAIVPVVVCACLTSGCFGLRAKAVMAPTPLDMPEPPPRVVEVREPEMPPPIPLPEEPVRNTPTRPGPNRPATEPARPAQPPSPAETPVEAAKPEELTPRPPTTLQTTPTQREEEVERRIRIQLAQAMADLNRINYQALTSDGRQQYEQAKRFVSQAEDALLRAKNLVFASNLADKAATIAAQLLGR